MADSKDISILGKDGQWHSLKGPPGPAGPPGPPLNIKDSVADEATLKAKATGNTKGDARIVEKTGDLWVWDGTKWVKTSHLKGDKGDPGRSMRPFEKKTSDPPPISSKPDDPATEPDKAHVGDVWFELPDSP